MQTTSVTKIYVLRYAKRILLKNAFKAKVFKVDIPGCFLHPAAIVLKNAKNPPKG